MFRRWGRARGCPRLLNAGWRGQQNLGEEGLPRSRNPHRDPCDLTQSRHLCGGGGGGGGSASGSLSSSASPRGEREARWHCVWGRGHGFEAGRI